MSPQNTAWNTSDPTRRSGVSGTYTAAWRGVADLITIRSMLLVL
jgi:hypothetical protein